MKGRLTAHKPKEASEFATNSFTAKEQLNKPKLRAQRLATYQATAARSRAQQPQAFLSD